MIGIEGDLDSALVPRGSSSPFTHLVTDIPFSIAIKVIEKQSCLAVFIASWGAIAVYLLEIKQDIRLIHTTIPTGELGIPSALP